MSTKSKAAAGKIKKLIESGAYLPGSKLPPERDLAERFGLSQGTLAKAIFILAGEGLVKKVHGSGNYVSSPKAPEAPSICFLLDAMGNDLNPIIHSIYEHFYFCGLGSSVRIELVPIFDKSSLKWTEGLESYDLLVVGSGLRRDKERVLAGLKRHVLWLDEGGAARPGATVCNDNFAAGMLAARHLIEEGCRRMLYLTYSGCSRYVPNERRFDGFLEGVRASGESACAVSSFPCFPSEPSFRDELEAHLRNADGVLCFSDGLAAKALRALAGSGKSAPKDFALIGIDGLPFGEMLSPSLTSVKQDCKGIAKAAWDLAKRILGGERMEGTMRIKPKLLVRESSKRSSALQKAV